MEKKKIILSFKEEDYLQFREQLLKIDRLERQSFCFTGISNGEQTMEILVHKMINPLDIDYNIQGEFIVDVKPEFLLKTFSEFNDSGVTGFLHAHSHPFTGKANFSSVDDDCVLRAIRSIKNYMSINNGLKDFFFIRLVYGKDEDGFKGEIFNSFSECIGTVNEIKVIGKSGIKRIFNSSMPGSFIDTSNPLEIERLDRQIRWLGKDGQRRLSFTKLVLCGVGGVGSVLVANIRGLGFQEITLIDPDWIELNNLNRFIGAEIGDVGDYKVFVMEREIKKVFPEAKVKALPVHLETEEAHRAIIEGDVIISALDNLPSRFELQILAARYLKVLLDIGSGISLEVDQKTVKDIGGQIILYYPGGPCLACQGMPIFEASSGLTEKIRKAVGYIRGTEITPPSVVTINSVLGGAAINTLVKYLIGFPVPSNHIKYDLLKDTITHFNFEKKSDCPICGTEGVEGKGDESIEIIPCLQEDLKAFSLDKSELFLQEV